MSANDIADLMRQGIEAARAGSKTEARAFFEQVVELDDQNEKAWFWLASVLEDDTQKRMALNTVLHLNPGNDRARKALDLLEAQTRDTPTGDEIIPGVPRRTFYLVAGIGGAIIVLLIGLFLVVTINNNRASAELLATQTGAVVNALNTSAAITQQALAFAQTQAATTPTAVDLQAVVATLPPTFTPTAEATLPPTREPLAFPPNLSGRLAAWGGRDFEQDGYYPVGTILTTDGTFTRAGEQEGLDVALSPSGDRLVYTRFQPAIFGTLIEAININGTDARPVDDYFRVWLTLFDPQQPAYSASGDSIVFVGREEDSFVNQVYLVSLLEMPPPPVVTADPSTGEIPPTPQGLAPIRRLTSDAAEYRDPEFSPDGTRVTVIRDDVNTADAGPDVYILDLGSGQLLPLTNDRAAFVESSPIWSPDGSQIAYAAAAASEPNNHDIVTRFASGGGQPTVIARDPADDRYPVFSPDGRYIAFSSNRSGPSYDVYVFDQADQVLYQLTNTPTENEFIGGWR